MHIAQVLEGDEAAVAKGAAHEVDAKVLLVRIAAGIAPPAARLLDAAGAGVPMHPCHGGHVLAKLRKKKSAGED